MNRLRWEWITTIALVVLTAVAYSPALRNEFTNWDDPGYVRDNPYVMQGLTAESVRYAFRTYDLGNYIPLTWLSYELDVTLFGRPTATPPQRTIVAGYVVGTNILLHVLNSVLCFWVLRQLTGSVGRSAAVAFLFAVHPLHVESVAWISERKDLLSMLFLLLSLSAYTAYARSGRALAGRGWYVLALVLFVLGLLSKPMLVTYPVLLLLVDVFVLHRRAADSSVSATVGQNEAQNAAPTPGLIPASQLNTTPLSTSETAPAAVPASNTQAASPPTLFQLVLEKAPFFVAALVVGLITIAAQGTGEGAYSDLKKLPLPYRLANMTHSYAWYITSTLAPVNLSPFYPHPRKSLDVLIAVLAAALILGFSIYVALNSRQRPILAFGWLWFLISLLPVIGILQVGGQAFADRYSYLPHFGLLALFVWEIAGWWERRGLSPRVIGIFAVGLVGACVPLTYAQTQIWRDEPTLWRHALRIDSSNYMALQHLRDWSIGRGDLDQALEYATTEVNQRPNDSEAARSLAWVYLRRDDLRSAHKWFAKALELNPLSEDAAIDLAGFFRQVKQYDTGIRVLSDLVKLKSVKNPYIYRDLGRLKALQGDFAGAANDFKSAIQILPQDPALHHYFGLAVAELKQPEQALPPLKRAVELAPNKAKYHVDLALQLKLTGDLAGAGRHLAEAVRLDPDDKFARAELEKLSASP